MRTLRRGALASFTRHRAIFVSEFAPRRLREVLKPVIEILAGIPSVVLGSTLLVSMRDLFGIFLAIELATIPSYAMVAFDRRRRESAEGGMKYLITGVVASSVLLYGIVLIYGVSGSAQLADVAKDLNSSLDM